MPQVGERTLGFLQRIVLPEPSEPDKGFKECCYVNLVLADELDDDDYKNDYYTLFEKKQTEGDTCDFVLQDLVTATDYVINDDTYGIWVPYGGHVDQPDVTTFKVEWRKVLTILGPGNYQIRKDLLVGGLSQEKLSNTFTLKPYSLDNADLTIRFDTEQNGYLKHYDVNLKGTGFKSTLRMCGFFGRREPDYVQENYITREEEIIQNNMIQENEYLFQANSIPICITRELFDFFMFGNNLWMNDYNRNNHDYGYKRFGVIYKSNKGTKYNSQHRNAQINLSFEDRKRDKRKQNC